MSKKPVEERVSIACTKISVYHPFFAAFLLRMNVIPSNGLPTMGTDGRTIWYNPAWTDQWTDDEIMGVLVHEVLHIVLKHHLRIGKRDKRKANKAADYVIDPIVLSSGFSLPTGPDIEHHHDTKYDGMTFEQVYELLPDEPEQEGGGKGEAEGGGESNGGSAGIGDFIEPTNDDGSALSESELEAEETRVDQVAVVAADAAKSTGRLPAGIVGHINSIREAQVPWQDILRRFIGGDTPDGHNFARPARHQWHHARLVMPTVQKTGVGELVIAIDTSASMSDAELKLAFSECRAIIDDMMPNMTTIIYADSKVQKVDEFEKGETIDRLDIKGRGGTRVRPAIDYAIKNIDRVDRFIYITDMEFSDYGTPPPFEVLWVGTMTVKPKYGEFVRIRLPKRG